MRVFYKAIHKGFQMVFYITYRGILQGILYDIYRIYRTILYSILSRILSDILWYSTRHCVRYSIGCI